MSKYIVTKATVKKHKKIIIFMSLITYILFFPFVILAYINDFLEKTLNFVANLRYKIIYGSVKLLFKKDCKEVEKDDR